MKLSIFLVVGLVTYIACLQDIPDELNFNDDEKDLFSRISKDELKKLIDEFSEENRKADEKDSDEAPVKSNDEVPMEDLLNDQTAVDDDNDNNDEDVPNDTEDQDASDNDVAGVVPVDKEDDAQNDDNSANIQAQPESSDLEPLSIPEQVRDEDEPIPLVEAEDTPEAVVKDSQDPATNDVTNDNPSVNEPFDVPELTPEEIPQADENQNVEFIVQNDANTIPENNAEGVPQDARNHHITVYSETGNTPGEFKRVPVENDEFSMENEKQHEDNSNAENDEEDRQNVRALGNLNQDMLYDALKYESLKDHIDLDEDEHETVAKISKDVLLRLVKKFSEQKDDKDNDENNDGAMNIAKKDIRKEKEKKKEEEEFDEDEEDEVFVVKRSYWEPGVMVEAGRRRERGGGRHQYVPH